MTDIRRTLLWVVFSMSLVLLWDAWNKHNGQPSLFGPPPATEPARDRRRTGAAGASGVPCRQRVPRPPAHRPRRCRRRGGAAAPAPATPAASRSRVDHRPGQGRRSTRRAARWCGSSCCSYIDPTSTATQQRRAVRPSRRSACTCAQTGLIRRRRRGLPNHQTPDDAAARRARAAGRRRRARAALRVAPTVGGVKLRQDLHASSAATTRSACKHEIVNDSARAGDAAAVPAAGARRQRAARRVEFYFTFTGPAVYTEAKKFQKIEFKDIEKQQGRARPRAAPTTAGSRWCSTTSRRPGCCRRRRAARVLHAARSTTTSTRSAMIAAAGRARARRDARRIDATLFAGPQEEKKLERAGARPRAGQGLRLLHDPRQAAVLAARPAAQAARQLGLGDRRRWWCC